MLRGEDDDAPAFAASGSSGGGRHAKRGTAPAKDSKKHLMNEAHRNGNRNNNRRNRGRRGGRGNKARVFSEYLEEEEVEAGIAAGDLFVAEFRVNAHNPSEGYATTKPAAFDQDVFINGLVARNRAWHGDTVVLSINPEDMWKTFEDAEEGSRNFGREPQPSGKVVAILDDSNRPPTLIGLFKSSRRDGTIRPSDRVCLFQPLERKQPRLLVPVASESAKKILPDDFLTRFDDYKHTMFQVDFVEWLEDSRYGFGHVAANLGSLGNVANEERAILLANSIRDAPFSARVLQDLEVYGPFPESDDEGDESDAPDGAASSSSSKPVGLGAGSTAWPIPPSELARRRDFRGERVLSIDPLTARDLDDALSVRTLDEEHVEVGVHIADVTYFVREGTSLDKEAASRSTSVYLVNRVIPMLPRLLCEQLCSLQPGVERLTFSVAFKMNVKTGRVVDTWFGRSVINSCAQMAYEHAQALIDGNPLPTPEEGGPILFHDVSVAEVSHSVVTLAKLARKLRAARFAGGSLALHNPKLSFKLNEEMTEPIGFGNYEIREANQMIEEFMLLANRYVAKRIYDTWPNAALLRSHPPPNERKMTEVIGVLRDAGYVFDASSSGALHASLEKIRGGTTQEDRDVYMVVMDLLSSPMQSAQYFCTAEMKPAAFHHYALAMPYYTHFTSPIRRYPDCIVHRQLAAALDEPEEFASDRTTEEIETVAERANEKKDNAKSASDASGLSYLCVFLKARPIRGLRLLVTGVGERSFTLLAPQLGGADDRVYVEDLDLNHEATMWDADARVLSLTWADGGKSRVAIFEPMYADVIVNKRRIPHVPKFVPRSPSQAPHLAASSITDEEVVELLQAGGSGLGGGEEEAAAASE